MINNEESSSDIEGEITEEKYSDEYITITNNELIINKYYFPTLKRKTIFLNKIKNVKIEKLGTFTGKYRFMGLNLNLYWLHLDKSRPFKDKVIVIDDGSYIKPAITPSNIEQVYQLLIDLIKK